MTGPANGATRLSRADLVLSAIAVAAGAALLFAYVVAILRENVNWDELGLVARTVDSLRSRTLIGDGRPGLATLILMPFADGCTSAVDVVRNARFLWLGWVLAYLAGIAGVVAQLREPVTERRWLAPTLSIALVVLVPAFQRWGLHIRADQPSLAFALWGAVALLASQRRPWLAVLAGAAFSVGFLFSQKAVYIVALALLLAGGQALMRRSFALRRDALRATLCVAGAAAVMIAFHFLVAMFFTLPATTLQNNLDSVSFYRNVIGLRVYRAMLPTLAAHGLVIGLLLLRSLNAGDAWRRLLVAWGILALGVAVALFHGARFPYFWTTLGVFPAVAAGLSIDSVLERFARRVQGFIIFAIFAILLVKGLPAVWEVTRDTQSGQRDTLAFIDRNFAPDDRGFQPERALACRREPDPFPTLFYPSIRLWFYGPEGPDYTARMLHEHRARPVKFVVESFRLAQFPSPLLSFWNDAYVPYYRSVAVAGKGLAGRAGTRLRFEAVASADFRVHLFDADPGAHILVDGATLGDGDAVHLAPGLHPIELLGEVRAGILALALSEPPAREAEPFFSANAMLEIGGEREW